MISSIIRAVFGGEDDDKTVEEAGPMNEALFDAMFSGG